MSVSIDSKAFDALEKTIACMKDGTAPADVSAFFNAEREAPGLADGAFTAALQLTPAFQKFAQAEKPGKDASLDDVLGYYSLVSDMVRDGMALRRTMVADWIAAGCPAQAEVKAAKPLQLKRPGNSGA